jgi:hypothetical protein
MTTLSDRKQLEGNLKATETWYQDVENRDLWFGEHGVMVNTAALSEREFYYDVIRVAHHPTYPTQAKSLHA